MRISIIVAMASNRVIGVENKLPWHLPADLKHFKAITMGKPIVMGRRTHESIGRALPGRQNIVITSNKSYEAEGCTVVHSFETALARAGGYEEVMIIGGSALYASALPTAQRVYLTRVHATFDGDVYFPAINEDEWSEVACDNHVADEKNPHDYSFVTLDRITRTEDSD